MLDLVCVFARLKARLLINALRRSGRARVGLLLLSIALAVATGLFVGVVRNSSMSANSGARMSAAFTSLWLAWVGLPFLLGGVDDAIDPDRLADLPLSMREVAVGTVVAASIGILPGATVAALTMVIAVLMAQFPLALSAFALLVLVGLGQFVLCLVSSRLLATGLVRASRSRRGRDVGVIVAALASSGLWMATQALNVASPGTRRLISTILEWTPAGAFGWAVHDVVTGHMARAVIRLAFGAGAIVLMAWWWMVEMAKSMGARRSGALRESPVPRRSRSYAYGLSEQTISGGRRRARGPINHPVFVIVRKELRYLLRSPYRRASLLVGCFFGAPFVLLQSTRINPDTLPPVAIAPIALLFGIAISHNLLGLDASSLWIELGTGVRMRDLLLGRALAAAPTLIMPVWLSALLTVVVTGNSHGVVPTLALSIVAAGVPLGVGALVSVLVPFPVADDSSPLGNQSAMTGRGCLVGIVHAVGLVVSAVLLSPVLAFGVMRGRVDVATVVACAAWSVVVLGSGVWLGERFADHRPGALAETVLAGLR